VSDDDAVRAVCFDLDGTLAEFPGDYATVVHDVTERHLGAADEAFEATYSERFFDLLGAHEPEPYRRAFEHALVEHDYASEDVDATAMVATLREREVEFVEPPGDARRVLAALRDRGYRVGVVTNGVPDWQRAKVAGNDLDEYVDAFVASYEAGAHKPDESPFALAADRLDADELVMVGDSYEADVQGARALGWRAIHYAPDGSSPDGSSLDEHAVESFDELLDRLD